MIKYYIVISQEDFILALKAGKCSFVGEGVVSRPVKRGVKAWWRFYISGLLRAIRVGAKSIRNEAFTYDTFASLAYSMVQAAENAGVDIEFDGFEALNVLGGKPFVAVANHMSLAETMLLPAALSAFGPVSCIAKKSLASYPGFGAVLRAIRPILLEQKNARKDLADTFSQGEALLKDGISLLLFPQGHRLSEFDAHKFNSLGSKLAKKAGVPIVPIACKTDFAMPGKMIADLGPIDPKKKCRFSCGPVLSPELQQSELQTMCISHIANKLVSWDMHVKGVNDVKGN